MPVQAPFNKFKVLVLALATLLALGAQAKQLQPVFFNGIAAVAANVMYQLLKIVAGEVLGETALLADEQMLMPTRRGQKRVTTARLMHALDQPKLFQLFECAVDSNQADAGIALAGLFINRRRAEHMLAAGNDLNHGLTWRCKAVAVGLKLAEPAFCINRDRLRHGLIENEFQ
jgi:hypothetical protein